MTRASKEIHVHDRNPRQCIWHVACEFRLCDRIRMEIEYAGKGKRYIKQENEYHRQIVLSEPCEAWKWQNLEPGQRSRYQRKNCHRERRYRTGINVFSKERERMYQHI